MKKTGKLMMVLALGILMSLTGCSKKIVEGPRIGVIQLMELQRGTGSIGLQGRRKLHACV